MFVIAFLALALVVSLSLAMAAKLPRGWNMNVEPATIGQDNPSNDTINQTIQGNSHDGDENELHHQNEIRHNDNQTRNMTHGRCVSNETRIRNVCYLAAKVKKYECILEAKNQTEANRTIIKVAVFQCKEVYKEEKEQCKVVFKEAKNLCKQYKKNYKPEDNSL